MKIGAKWRRSLNFQELLIASELFFYPALLRNYIISC